MNEHDFQFRVRQHLNTSARQVSPSVASRLHDARQKALGRQKVTVRRFSLAGISHAFTERALPQGRTAIAMVLILLLVVGSGLLGEMQRMAELEEVDSALLSDDLPIDAYLDQGFDAWVQNNSPD
jgi:hypothetical protein